MVSPQEAVGTASAKALGEAGTGVIRKGKERCGWLEGGTVTVYRAQCTVSPSVPEGIRTPSPYLPGPGHGHPRGQGQWGRESSVCVCVGSPIRSPLRIGRSERAGRWHSRVSMPVTRSCGCGQRRWLPPGTPPAGTARLEISQEGERQIQRP